eukprot:jgi/Galph1/3353/GphlegSOOS_G2044.1
MTSTRTEQLLGEENRLRNKGGPLSQVRNSQNHHQPTWKHETQDEKVNECLPALDPENDEGFVEYKWSLHNTSPQRFAQLVTQLKFRLLEGQGEAFYEIGVTDNGILKGLPQDKLNSSLLTLEAMARELDAEVHVIRQEKGLEGNVVEALVRHLPRTSEEYLDLRIAVAGNVDSGKSTLVGVLTGNGTLDNGRGLARSQIFTHKHEMETGRTSCVSQQIMGFNAMGEIVNYSSVRNLSWSDVLEKSSKVLTFFDLAGHERYLKTTVFGLTAHVPDYCMIVIGANMGVLRMTKEHLAVALALKVPVFIIITKIDIAPSHILENTRNYICKLLKSPGARKLPVIVKSLSEVSMVSQNIVNDRIVPVFEVSSVTGQGLDLLGKFLNLVPTRRNWLTAATEPTEFQIDETFMVTGVGTVVAGTTISGSVSVGQFLHLGPDSAGNFVKVQIKSIHYKRTPVKKIVAGQTGSLALKKIKRSFIRKGMVLLDSGIRPGAVWEFYAEVMILYHSSTIRVNYQAVIHCAAIRQAAKVVSIDSEVARTGDRTKIHFRFLYHPEYLKGDSRFIFREGRTKGIGKVIGLGEAVHGRISHPTS